MSRKSHRIDPAAPVDGPAREALTNAVARGLPAVAPQRRPGLAALAVLLTFGGASTTTLLVMRADDRVSVVRMTKQVGAGRTFSRLPSGRRLGGRCAR
ncbi:MULTISPECIES: hypothetical protein [unclassified Nonomuraea]|uniref:hypothetical protein n=1 Tax=unclassified Nonomuraea TaxID=2593643 RepID=UPI0033D48073